MIESSQRWEGALLLQIAAAQNLREEVKKGVQGRAKLGVEAFAEALLGVPKILAENCGYDPQVQIAEPHLA